ncbi:hypothetical protein [Bradyrhizobium sp. 168]|uniref:hypothetical protein n=1 Tax=Bradyrhizobium sp. 168 TaxID=2782639 RepID=UPI003211B319
MHACGHDVHGSIALGTALAFQQFCGQGSRVLPAGRRGRISRRAHGRSREAAGRFRSGRWLPYHCRPGCSAHAKVR